MSVSETALLAHRAENAKEVKATSEAWKERKPFKFVGIVGVVIQVQCPNCGEFSDKILYSEELKQELEQALCPRCKKLRGIKVPEVVTELRTLL